MTRAPIIVAAVALAVLLAGCGSTAADQVAVPTSAAPTTGAPSATPSPTGASPAPSPEDVVLRLGQSRESTGGEVVSTVYGYKQPVARDAPGPEGQDGFEWGAVDLKVCVSKDYTGDPIAVSSSRWVLVYDDDTQIGASNTTYEYFPKPEYPLFDKELAPGRCVRGWATFPVPAKTRPAFVEYAAESEAAAPPRWALK